MKKPIYTTVYRVEHPKDRMGPYNSEYTGDDLIARMREAHSDDENHPVLWRDGAPASTFFIDNVLYGFKSLQQLKQWFAEFLKPILDAGFKVVKYFVPTKYVINARHQVAFYNEHSPVNKPLPTKQIFHTF